MTLYEVTVFYGHHAFSLKRHTMRLEANVRVEAARQALDKLTVAQAHSLERITIGDAIEIDANRKAMAPKGS